MHNQQHAHITPSPPITGKEKGRRREEEEGKKK